MEISYFGQSAFKIVGKNITIITDPFDADMVGLKAIKSAADVVTVSHNHGDHNNVSAVSENPMVFDGPGEFEIKDSAFEGIEAVHGGGVDLNNTIFIFEIDDVKLCHLGDLGAELDGKQLEKIDGVDILFIPVGGKFTINAEEASKVIAQVEPKIVIPMHYKTANSKITELEGVDKFLHVMGISAPDTLPRLKVFRKDLPEEMRIVVLET